MTRTPAATKEKGFTGPVVGPGPGTIDYDLHGALGVRVVGASAVDAKAVSRQLGSLRGALSRDPEIVVRFVQDLPGSADLRYLGLDDVGFDDDSFYVLSTVGKRQLRTRLALDQVGGRCEIVCESGLGAVPFLIPIVNLTMLARGLVPVHASAFSYDGTGALVTGWAKGGKTELLLGFMDRGARYVGDEWVYLHEGRLYGLPEPMRIWDWHLDDLDRYRRRISAGPRARMWLTRRASGSRQALPDHVARTEAGRFLNRLLALVERQSNVRIEPERLFGRENCVLEGSLDRVFFLVSHESPEITVEPLEPEELVRSLVFSHEYERRDLTAAYLQWRFAFPDRVNALLENAREQETTLLAGALAGTPAYVVRHPFPAPIRALADAVLPLL